MKIKRNTLILWKRILFISVIFLFTTSLFYVIFKTSTFTIYSYKLVGVPDIYKDSIDLKLRSIAIQPIYKIFPSNRVFMYRANDIKLAIVDILPNSEYISIRPDGLHTIKINVKSYEPLFKVDDFRGITKEGVIYTEFKNISLLPTLYIASSTNKEVVKDGITSTVISGIDTNKLINISKLVSKINSVIFKVSKIEIDAYGDISLYDERLISKIIFSRDGDVDRVWSNIVSAIDTDPLKSKLINNKDKLEYLDARFGNKVFYKFTNDSKTAIIQSHATTTATTSVFR